MEPLKRARAAFLPGKRSAAPDPAAGRPEVAGIDLRWLFESSIVRLNRWHCRETATGLTGERQQFWRVIGFVHAGAYELLSPRGTVLVDPIKVAFLNPFEAYRTRHPCGCGDHGSPMIVREDVLREIVARRRPDLGDSAAGPFPKPAGPCPNGAFLRHRSLLRRLDVPGHCACRVSEITSTPRPGRL
ncbi:MAG TPA: hypothetical protein VGR67_11370 [Candidatus Polarisedimenticolia bacterium]|jgi:hypothetical protein|nr:hypothetical protein [Candidatus Polarisedimenticolia bacterium]